MTDQLHRMAAETMAALREKKALPEIATSAEVRYAADYIVKKSPFAPFFAALGITKGSQIGRTFDKLRDERFFKVIMQLYYAKWYFKNDVKELLDIPTRIKNDDWERLTINASFHYRRCLRELREAANASIGISKQEKYRFDMVRKELCQLIEFEGSDDKFMDKAILMGAFPDTVVLAAHITGRHKSISFTQWQEDHQEDIVDAFVCHGTTRALLTTCHEFKVTAWTGGMQKWDAEQEDRSTVCDITHYTLNTMATSYQDIMLHRLRMATTCGLMEAAAPAEEVAESTTTDHMHDEIFTTGGLGAASLPEEIIVLAKRLAKLHGPVTIASESNGIHIYIPDPELLNTDGSAELGKKHVSVNAEKYLGIGRYDVDKYPTPENKALYMKYRRHGKEVPCTDSKKSGKAYKVETLLSMLPLERRLSLIGEVKRTVHISNMDKHLVYDENGNLVPEWCGQTVSLKDLPTNHPARDYMERQRNYDLELLDSVWGVRYCTAALPEDRAVGRFYSRLPHGCLNSPTGRIILPVYDDEGVRRGWQARVIDFTNAHGDKFVWTDRQQWLQVAKNGQPLFVSEQWPKGFDAHKYLNARGSQRNALLFGLKQAVEYNSNRPFAKRYCVLVEGPLDAIRGGPPCIALLGKSISPVQAELIRKHFSVVCTIMDQDKAGKECLKRIYNQLHGMPIMELTVPEGKKDLGDCTYLEAYQLVTKYDPIQ